MLKDYGCILNFFRKSLDDTKSPVVAVVNEDEQHLDVVESEQDTLLQKLSAESNEMKYKLDTFLNSHKARNRAHSSITACKST